ncbi:hypothetical protein [Candidatus Villigracilis saccharophilus]|uniref:hypothetical protein n=1 Tax=Candidatus Villigracilis saccharophilus TaxID=3140684 RepID=UPI0031359F87|nr:hypothetical protein [Anaerolineales bacterium]
MSIIYLGVIFVDIAVNEPGADAPRSIGSFNVIESSTIDPTTILSSLNHDGQNVFNFKSDLPNDLPFVTSVEWGQVDYENLATSIFHVAWNESINDWNLYRMAYFTECGHPEGFSNGEFYFYLDTSDHKEYSARGILMEPEYGYVAWGGDTYYHRPLFGWKAINLKEVTVTAEEALRRAEARGGLSARQSWDNKCIIDVQLWPQGFGRNTWRVNYWNNDISNENRMVEFWIPAK